jgi:hypothetical protein
MSDRSDDPINLVRSELARWLAESGCAMGHYGGDALARARTWLEAWKKAEAIEGEAADLAYAAGLGVGEWEAFMTKPQWLERNKLKGECLLYVDEIMGQMADELEKVRKALVNPCDPNVMIVGWTNPVASRSPEVVTGVIVRVHEE